MVQKWYACGRVIHCFINLVFSWSNYMQYNISSDAGEWQWDAVLSQPCSHEGKQSFCTHAAILFFTFTTVFNKLHEISIVYYKIGWVLDDFI